MKCKATKEDDEQCNANAMNGSDFCYTHNPDIPEEEKKQAQANGGANRALILKEPLPVIALTEPSDAVLLVADTIRRVRAGELDIKTANCIGFLSDKLLKAFEISNLNGRLELVERTILKKQKY